MACDLRCPDCGENLGKDSENPGFAGCGTCGEDDIFNPHGYTDDMDEEELSRWKSMKRKRNSRTLGLRRRF